MKALICHKWGGPEELVVGELPSPTPGPGQIRIAPEAFGVNYADLVLIAGNYRFKPPFPFAPGLEIAGIVTATGPGTSRFRTGDRAMAYVEHGGYANQVVANEGAAFPVPPSMTSTEAAANTHMIGRQSDTWRTSAIMSTRTRAAKPAALATAAM